MATNCALKLKIAECCSVTRNEVMPKTPLDLLGFIVLYGDDVFPNLRISLQILLTIAVSIASCERSFSKLKLILSYLRASMGLLRNVSAIWLFLVLKEKHWKKQTLIM